MRRLSIRRAAAGMAFCARVRQEASAMLDRDKLIEDCRAAIGETSTRAVIDVVARAVADPNAIMRAFGEPTLGGVDAILRTSELTILNIHWPVGHIIMPHNHNTWAVIGIYSGREDNILWRRLPDDPTGQIEAAGAKSLGVGDTIAFGADVIHSVVNPVAQVTSAIHVYGGDFFAIERSEWDPQSHREKRFDLERALRAFERQPTSAEGSA
jgi:predicted metal-dependent enzyme (double-stranded beta helix superfamily)